MNGGLIFIVFSNPSGGGSANIDSNAPFVALWYRSTGTTNTLYTDRITPDFSPAGSTELSRIHYYPWNGNTYYGSAITVDTRVWNLNIVRSSSEIGTALGESGYTTYGSMEYNGQKHYLGFDEEYRQIGLIHFTNEFTGNTYGHEFVPGTTEVDIPHLLWHRHESIEGEGEIAGQRFSDSGSGVWSDPIALTTYTLLTDENTVDPWVVGRVYPKLKLIAITDPELLTALTYKSNRNWTLPPLITSRRSTPAPGYSVFDVEGSLSSGKTYYVTYGIDMRGDWNATKGFGYKPVLHCGYIQKVTGATDGEGRSAYLSAKFSSPSFPYLRSLAGMTAFSGTGWNANGMYIIMKEVDTTSDRGPDNVGADGWTAMTTKYGYYAGGEDGADTINPSYAINYEFIVDRDDLTGGTPYVLDTTFTENIDYKLSGNTINMTLGNECFFFGNIRTGIKRTTYKTVIFLEAATDQFNSSQNPTFYQGVDTSTYFTEIGILDDENRLVAVGKTSRPIEKNDAQHLVIQLELEF